MTTTTHLYDMFIRAPRERVWQALTDPDDTVRYFHGTRFDSTFETGTPFRNVIVDSDVLAVDGTVETFEPPQRLVMTWHVRYDAEMAAEPPGRVEWTLTPADAAGVVTRVSLRHGGLALSPRTWAHVRLGWVEIVDSLKSLLETGQPLPALTDFDDDGSTADGDWHRAQAVSANNSTWEYLDGRDHAPDDIDELLQHAYAAAYHWKRATGSTAVNLARASWLVSRAHAVLGQGEPALHHADRSIEYVEQAGTLAADFDHGYGFEARARALACLGRLDEAAAAHGQARAVDIGDDDDRAVFTGDLAAEPWFGLNHR